MFVNKTRAGCRKEIGTALKRQQICGKDNIAAEKTTVFWKEKQCSGKDTRNRSFERPQVWINDNRSAEIKRGLQKRRNVWGKNRVAEEATGSRKRQQVCGIDIRSAEKTTNRQKTGLRTRQQCAEKTAGVYGEPGV